MKLLRNLLLKFLPDPNKKKLKAFAPIIEKINSLKNDYSALSDLALKNKTTEFKSRLANGETLDDILPEAFACVREAAKRTLGQFHYEVQLLAGIALHKGMMTEMKTGEGKTLSASLAIYLNALTEKGVHIATVNDYLAKRDADEMGRIYKFLGLSCEAVLENMNYIEKKAVYSKDIVYGNGSTFAFDYLRDNMVYDENEICQRGLSYIIVDEADKLIDDGRTPCIISGASDVSMQFYSEIFAAVSKLTPSDYEINYKEKTAVLSEEGMEKIDTLFKQNKLISEDENLYSSNKLELVHGINQCIKALTLYKKDVDYIVKKNEILLIDEMTGRILDGRRLGDGLHQAIEAKEHVTIHNEGSTSASISFQKFFSLYEKFSGMSGTCMSEAEEFYEIYGVDTIVIPTNKAVIRFDDEDELYLSFQDKFNAIIKEVKESNEKLQPVLVITGSVEASDIFSNGFKALGLKHRVLNARYHKEEAEIIAEAGMPGAITIATNMAGRGTDIQLGGHFDMRIRKLREQGLSDAEIENQKPIILKEIQKNREIVIAAGGLYVIGTERNESRRVDDQARGRAGRQGDPGKSKFLMSLDDPLMKIFGNLDTIKKWMPSMVKPGEPIKEAFMTRRMEKAQNDVEAQNFDSRKYLLKYDSILDTQRNMIYDFRKKYLFGEDLLEQLDNFINFKINQLDENIENQEFLSNFKEIFGIQFNDIETAKTLIKNKREILLDKLQIFKFILLRTIDELWEKHLTQLSYLRQIVNLRGHAQKDPLTEYQIESFKLFEAFLSDFRDYSLKKFFNFEKEILK